MKGILTWRYKFEFDKIELDKAVREMHPALKAYYIYELRRLQFYSRLVRRMFE